MAVKGMHMVEAVSNELRPDKLNKMNSTVFDSFTKITDQNESVRLDGGVMLLRYLLQQTSDETENKEFKYAMTRLIRSLGSSRICSKKGFYTTLTVFLMMHPEVSIEKFLSILDIELHAASGNNKSENADIYMGRILAYGALIRSKLLSKNTNEIQSKIIQDLVHSGKQRSYLSFVSTSFLVEFINQIDITSVKTLVWPIVKKEYGKPWSEQTLDSLYILLIMNDKFPSLVNHKFLKEHFNTAEIITKESMEHIVKVLTDLPRIISCNHPIFKLFCEKLIALELAADFWVYIDKRFVKPSKTDEYLATNVLKLILSNITDKSILPSLLSPNFIQHMLKKFSTCKRRDNDDILVAFREIFNLLVSVTNDKDIKVKTQISVLKKLMLYPGDLMIERKTGTKVIQMITGNLNLDGIKKLSKIYRDIIENTIPKEQENTKSELFWTNAERIYAAHLLSRLMKHSATLTDQEWRLDQLKFLFTYGLCEMQNVGVELAPQFKETFYHALDYKLPKLHDLRNILSALVHHVDSTLKSETLQLRNPLTDEMKEVWKKVIRLIEKLENNSKQTEALPVFHTMNLHMGLQLFSDPNMAIMSINELQSCYERLLKKSKKHKTARSGKEDEPEWVEVVIDLLLSLFSKNSHLLRSLVGCVFPHICPYITPAAIHHILEVLDIRNEKGPLVDRETLDDEESNIESNSDHSSDSEDDEESKTEGSENSSDENDSDSDEDSVEEEDETVTDRVRMAVRQALGDASIETDDADIDVEQIDEEEGKRLDESLAAAFRILRENRKPLTKKQEKSAQALTHFRIRVIDLLETYIETGPSMAVALDMLVPLFALLEYCIKDPHQKPLQDRVRSCLKKLSTVKKFKDTEGVNDELITVILKALIEKGERTASVCHEMSDKLAECSTFLVRCAQQANLSMDPILDIYGENLTAFFKKRDCVLPPMLFKSILQLQWEGNWQLAPLLVDFAFDSTVRSFRRGQALEFLTVFYNNSRLVHMDTKHTEARIKMENKLCKNTISIFRELHSVPNDETKQSVSNSTNEIGKEVRQRYVCLLLTLLRTIYVHHLPQSWNWKDIGEVLTIYRTHVSFAKDTKRAYNRLAVQIGIPVNVSRKRNNSEQTSTNNEETVINNVEESKIIRENGNTDNEADGSLTKAEVKKQKKHKSNKKDKQLRKKEARLLREKAMSEGFESFHFSSFALPDKPDENKSLQNGDSPNQDQHELKSPYKRALTNTIDDNKPKRKKNIQTV